ncbi:uncharacterized protein K444DRAFT_474040, partial [Hyaloscypha bicolor E]
NIQWVVPTLSSLCTGFGLFPKFFLQLLNYIVDASLMFAASAIAGTTFMRSLAINPLFACYIYESIVINNCQTLVRTIAIVSVPSPFVFNFNGRQIR